LFMDFLQVDNIIKNALIEDIGSGDITTDLIIKENFQVDGEIVSKEKGILCGTQVVQRTFFLIDPEIKVEALKNDGQRIAKGEPVIRISGSARSILKGERVALNFLQRLSGIATKVNRVVNLVNNDKVKIADTRKTTPGLRLLEKYAVRIGGGYNHRWGLYDSVLIKENHIKASGGIKQAIQSLKGSLSHTVKIEVEVETLDQIEEAVAAGVDIILLDNMSSDEMKKAVKHINKRCMVEASGNITCENVTQVAETGVDVISIGSLTHSVRAHDFSLRIL